MSSYRRFTTRYGKSWYAGSYIPWANTEDQASIIIPIDQIEGLTNAQIGQSIRESLTHARRRHAIETAEDMMGYVLQQSENELDWYVNRFREFADSEPSVNRAIVEIEQELEKRAARQARLRPKRTAQTGYIYLVEGKDSYKIGKSKDLPSRVRSFGLQLPFRVTLIHSIPVSDMTWAERYLHCMFARCRLNGEWFDLTPDDVAWVCGLTELEPQ